jgi:predicted nucleotidyltransferase
MTREEAIAEITRRLAGHYQPERIYLFGSVARGDGTPDSDLDFLVVVPDDAPRELLRGGAVYHLLAGTGYPKDVIPWRRTDFDIRAAEVVASLPGTVLRERKLLDDARRRAA